MKAEINNENKAKFFALYWKQNVMEYPKDNLAGRSGGVATVGWMISTDVTVHGCLNLKPLSSISYEDAIELNFKSAEEFVYWVCKQPKIVNHLRDELRFLGYAYEWMGLSVEEMVNAGWVKLVEL